MTPPATPQARDDSRKLRAVAIVPARLGSTRLPRKMLLDETGRALVLHTAANVAAAGAFARVVVATDSQEIRAAAAAEGVEALLTSPDHQSGTDRANEALGALLARGEGPYDVVVNVQGDEPEVPAADLAALVACFADPRVEVATLAGELDDARELADPSVVKVVVDGAGDALYFSRAPVPDARHARPGARHVRPRRHLGVYAFRPAALAAFCALPVGALEATESLEQLRWLGAGRRMRVLPATRVPRGIDTEADYRDFVRRARAASGAGGGTAERGGRASGASALAP